MWVPIQLDARHSIECKLAPATRSSSTRFRTLWPCNPQLWPFDLKTISFLGHPRSFAVPSLKTLGSLVFFQIMLQTIQIHTDADERLTLATVVGVSTVTTSTMRWMASGGTTTLGLDCNRPLLRCHSEQWKCFLYSLRYINTSLYIYLKFNLSSCGQGRDE